MRSTTVTTVSAGRVVGSAPRPLDPWAHHRCMRVELRINPAYYRGPIELLECRECGRREIVRFLDGRSLGDIDQAFGGLLR